MLPDGQLGTQAVPSQWDVQSNLQDCICGGGGHKNPLRCTLRLMGVVCGASSLLQIGWPWHLPWPRRGALRLMGVVCGASSLLQIGWPCGRGAAARSAAREVKEPFCALLSDPPLTSFPLPPGVQDHTAPFPCSGLLWAPSKDFSVWLGHAFDFVSATATAWQAENKNPQPEVNLKSFLPPHGQQFTHR
jgi:hypothetical protein